MDKRLEEMSVIEKANVLQSLVAKADLEVDYAIQVKWKTNKDDEIREIGVLLDNTRNLFSTGRIDNLDYDVRNSTIENYNNRLTSYITMFPEYDIELEEEQGTTKRHF